MIFNNVGFNFQEFMTVLDKCEGNIFIHTQDGDVINMKSKLSQIIGISKLIIEGTISIDRLETDNYSDDTIITRYLLYREVPK